MSNRERRNERASWLMRRDLVELGNDLRSARLANGLTMRAIAGRIGVSPATILRVERANFSSGPSPEVLARQAAAVGLRVRIRAYPEGPPLRDAPQIALERKFLQLLGPDAPPLVLEQGVTDDPRDRRAFDATLDIPGGLGLEFVTRFHDCQAQLRVGLQKQRDAGLARLVFVVNATHANRLAVASAADVIATTFPLGTRAVLRALRAGRDPGANGLIFI
jgi:transcriptional regulator with XRE-family HTH domain